MKMPEFIAEASLYQSEHSYSHTTTPRVVSDQNAVIPAACWSYHGKCTGGGWWAKKQCVIGMADSADPTSPRVTQCCEGWFQYPWIEACPGEPVKKGCGVCAWD